MLLFIFGCCKGQPTELAIYCYAYHLPRGICLFCLTFFIWSVIKGPIVTPKQLNQCLQRGGCEAGWGIGRSGVRVGGNSLLYNNCALHESIIVQLRFQRTEDACSYHGHER